MHSARTQDPRIRQVAKPDETFVFLYTLVSRKSLITKYSSFQGNFLQFNNFLQLSLYNFQFLGNVEWVRRKLLIDPSVCAPFYLFLCISLSLSLSLSPLSLSLTYYMVHHSLRFTRHRLLPRSFCLITFKRSCSFWKVRYTLWLPRENVVHGVIVLHSRIFLLTTLPIHAHPTE